MSLIKRWSVTSVLIALVALTSLLAYQRKVYSIGGQAAICMKDQKLYEAPDDRSEELVDLGPGNKVYILDQIGDWYKVQLRDKDVGWVRMSDCQMI